MTAQEGRVQEGRLLRLFGSLGVAVLVIGIFIGGIALIFTSIEGALLILGSITAFFMLRSSRRAEERKQQQSQQAPPPAAPDRMARPSPQTIRPEPIRRRRPREISRRQDEDEDEENSKQDQHSGGCTCGISQNQKGPRS